LLSNQLVLSALGEDWDGLLTGAPIKWWWSWHGVGIWSIIKVLLILFTVVDYNPCLWTDEPQYSAFGMVQFLGNNLALWLRASGCIRCFVPRPMLGKSSTRFNSQYRSNNPPSVSAQQLVTLLPGPLRIVAVSAWFLYWGWSRH